MENRNLIYLACPYNHSNKTVRDYRVESCKIAVNELSDSGLLVYSPLVYTRYLQDSITEQSEEFWLKHGLAMLYGCTHLYVLKLEGWKESKGVAKEIREADKRKMPIKLLEPNEKYTFNNDTTVS